MDDVHACAVSINVASAVSYKHPPAMRFTMLHVVVMVGDTV